MSGEQTKALLLGSGISLSEIGRRLHMSSQHLTQAFSVADVKSGFLERLAIAFDLDISFFYPRLAHTSQTIVNKHTGNENIMNGNVEVNVPVTSGTSEEALLLLIKQNQQILDMLKNK